MKTRQLMKQVQFKQAGPVMHCRVRMADGRVLTASAPLAGELGWFGSKATRKVGKGLRKGAQLAHNITHKGPIGKAHMAVQKAVAKYLPIAKPFINIHNKLASPVHKVIEGKKVRAAATAKAIASVTKDLPAAQKAVAQKKLAALSAATEKARDAGKIAALAKVAAKAKEVTKGVPGFYVVTRPDGRIVKVPSDKVKR